MTSPRKLPGTTAEARERSQSAIVQATNKGERLITAEGKEVIITEKFKDWCALYFDKTRPETYGNATRSALAVYNTDSYYNAGAIGYTNSKKLQIIARTMLDNEGFGMADLLKIGLSKMTEGSFSDWKAFMEMLGYFDPKGYNDRQPENTFNFENLNVAIMRDREARGLKG